MADTIDSGTYTPETVARRQKIAEMLLGDSMKQQPITHWAEGLAQMGRAAMGGYMANQANEEAKAGETAQNDARLKMLGLDQPASAAPVAQPSAPSEVQIVPADQFNSIDAMADLKPETQAKMPAAQNAVSAIESGGRYDAMGPVIASGPMAGQRANGKYQVMDSNVAPWTKQVMGRAMTPQEFIANPDAQDAVFNGKFGGFIDKYGADGAARAWHAGEGGMNNAAAKDQLGTKTADYGRNVAAALNSDDAAIPQAARPTQAVAQALNTPSVPAADQSGSKAQIAKMLRDPNPYVRKQGAALADAMIQTQFKGDAPTDEIKEYNLYKRQGGDKSFFDYKAGLKKAGAQSISIDQRGEAAFDTAAAKHQAERFDKIVSGGMDAKAMRADLDALKDIGSRITTGKTAELTAALGPYAEAAGIKIDGLDDLQAYKSIVSKLAPRMRVVGSGATSDYEMRQFLEALPGLGKTQGGNEMISATLQALQDHKEQAAEIASQAMNKEITPRQADKMLRELPDPLTAWKSANKKDKLQATPPAQSGQTKSGLPWKVID